MNETLVEVLRFAAAFLVLLELILGLYILLLNPRQRANRYTAALVLLIAADTWSLIATMTATNAAAAHIPFIFVAALTPPVSGMILLTTLVLARPDWGTGNRRWMWILMLMVLFAPPLFTLLDVNLGTQIYYIGFNESTYLGGALPIGDLTRGSLIGITPVLIVVAGFPVLALLALIYLRWRDRHLVGSQKRLLNILLLVQIFGVSVEFLSGNAVEGVPTIITSAIYALGYATATFDYLSAENRLQAGRLQWRLTSLLLVITIPIVVFISINLSYESLNAIQINNDQSLEQKAQLLAANINQWVRLNTAALQQTMSLPDIVSMQAAQQKPALVALARNFPHLYLVSTTDLQGQNIARSDELPLTNYSDRTWFQSALFGSELSFQTLGGRSSGSPALVVSTPIRGEQGNVVGVGMFATELTDLAAQIRQIQFGELGEAYIVDAANQLLAHPTMSGSGQLLNFGNQPPVQALRNGTTGLFSYIDDQGISWRCVLVPLEHNWGLVVQQPDEDIAISLSDFRRTAVAMSVLSVAIIIVLVGSTIRQTLKPIESMTQAAQRMARGDLSQQIVTLQSKDEFSDMASALNQMQQQLREVITSLEQRVEARTAELNRRTAYLEGSALIGRAVNNILDPDELVRQVVGLIRETFDLYYVGLFLVDENNEWAVLRAGTGEAGKAMLERNHRLKIGPASMIGWCISNGRERVALRAETDIVRAANPDLPLTRSEGALPLRSRGIVIGALTVQSVEPNAFTPEIIQTLQNMADQVASAIENARLYTRSQQALEAAQRAIGDVAISNWQKLLKMQSATDLRSTSIGLNPAQLAWSEQHQQALTQNKILRAAEPDEYSRYAVWIPIRSGAVGLGVMTAYKTAAEGTWSDAEVTLLQTIIEQSSVALESARVFEETRRRAERDRLTSRITTSFRETLDVETVLRTAAQEVRQALGLPEVVIRLIPPKSDQ
ncbi:MAG: hypothetical protein OHK0052_00130 [Anaerolineales bacterium]